MLWVIFRKASYESGNLYATGIAEKFCVLGSSGTQGNGSDWVSPGGCGAWLIMMAAAIFAATQIGPRGAALLTLLSYTNSPFTFSSSPTNGPAIITNKDAISCISLQSKRRPTKV